MVPSFVVDPKLVKLGTDADTKNKLRHIAYAWLIQENTPQKYESWFWKSTHCFATESTLISMPSRT